MHFIKNITFGGVIYITLYIEYSLYAFIVVELLKVAKFIVFSFREQL